MATIDKSTMTFGGYPTDTKILTKEFNAAVTNVSAADVVQILPIPAQTFVHQVHFETLTTEGGTLTIGVGDGAGATQYLTAADGNAATNSVSAIANGKFYATADTIDLTFNHAADVAKIKVSALVTTYP